jgi:hypothetical protein
MLPELRGFSMGLLQELCGHDDQWSCGTHGRRREQGDEGLARADARRDEQPAALALLKRGREILKCHRLDRAEFHLAARQREDRGHLLREPFPLEFVPLTPG